MTTVADLVAKLGFKVDDSGFNKFKNSLQAFQSIVRDGIKDLREYAKEAEKISRIMSKAYAPTKEEARERYLARTKQIKLNAESYKKRTDLLGSQLAIKQAQDTTRNRALALSEKNMPQLLALREASLKFKQQYAPQTMALKEAAQKLKNAQLTLNKEKFEYQKEKDTQKAEGKAKANIRDVILSLFRGGGSIFGFIGGAIGSLFGPLGTTIGRFIGKAVGGILMSLGRMIVNGIKSAIGYVMAFRDYRSFTGRSSSGLNNMMGMTKWMTNMGPQDILKDATAMGQAYWDMWFGGGNPAAWQLLGLTPTMNGETNLKNILNRIYGVTGGAKNKGLALNLLKQFGLSEDYMNLFYHWDEYKAMGGEGNFFGFSEKEIDSMEKANASLREFEMALNQAKVQIVQVLLDSGFQDALKTIVDYIKGVAKALKEGESVWSALTNAKRNIHYGSTGQWTTPKQWNASNRHWYDTEWSDYIPIYGQLNVAKRLLSSLFGIDMVDLASAPVQASQSTRNLFGGNTFNNTFNMQGQPLDQSVSAAQNIMSGEASQNQLSAGYTMMSTVPA